MKPNSSWSLREKDAAAPKANSLSAGGGPAGARNSAHAAKTEERVIWFIYRANQHRADVNELAAGLGIEIAEVREITKQMVRKTMLRELPKSADRPFSQFAVAPRLLQNAATLAAGPDPAEL